jgi:Skp family chaperone for outer membrane proteins
MPMLDMRPHVLSRQGWPIAIAVVALVFTYTLAVEASRPHVIQAAPTAVAVIDVARLVQEIDERGEWDMKMESLQAAVNQEAQDRQGAIERRLKESEAVEDAEQRQDVRDEVALMQLRFEQWVQSKTQEIDRERSLKWRSIYRNLRREAARVAETDGYELVLVNDATGEIRTEPNSQMPLEQQVLTQMLNRRILYSASPIDITEPVIVRMNNAAPQR